MSKDKDQDLPGRRRAGTVVSVEALEVMGLLTLYAPTTNSRTLSILTEDWLVKQGILADEARIHSKEDLEALVEGAKRVRAEHGTMRKL